jgi:hypothetical protein
MWIAATSGVGLPGTMPPLLRGIFTEMLVNAGSDARPGETPLGYLVRRMRNFAPLFPPPSPLHVQWAGCCFFSPAVNIEASTFNDPVARLTQWSAAIAQANRQSSALLETLHAPRPAHYSAHAIEHAPAAAEVTAISAGIDALVAEVLRLVGSHSIKDVMRIHSLVVQVQRMLAVLTRAIELRGAAAARRAAMQAL